MVLFDKCYDCPNRILGCHSICADYLVDKNALDMRNKIKYESNQNYKTTKHARCVNIAGLRLGARDT
jgi:hypothetical protein